MKAAKLREKAPEIIVEAISVVFAVLLALAVDEWREHRANQRLADQARESLLAEVQANLEELRSRETENRENLERLQAALSVETETRSTEPFVRYSQSILSSSAWETARVTGVMGFLDFEWVRPLSRSYEVQALFLGHQAELVRAITGFDDRGEDPRAFLASMRNRMQTVVEYQQGLIAEYETVLAMP